MCKMIHEKYTINAVAQISDKCDYQTNNHTNNQTNDHINNVIKNIIDKLLNKYKNNNILIV